MNKKITAILICGAMALSLAACGDSSKEAEQPDEVDVEGTDLFKGFIALTDEIGKMTYEEADEYVNSLGYPLSIENAETGEIVTENDENGFYMTVHTYKNDDGEETIYSIGYSCNGEYEVSADDYFHDNAVPTYYTYNEHASTPLQTVSSVDDMITFINDEVPELIAEYGDPNEEAEEEVVEEEEEPQVTDEMIAEEAAFLENLQAEHPDLYEGYMEIANVLSYTNAGIDAMINDLGAYKTTDYGGTDSEYYAIDQELFGLEGHYLIWVSKDSGSIMSTSYVLKSTAYFNKLTDDIDTIFGEEHKTETDENAKYYSWDTEDDTEDIHVATFLLEETGIGSAQNEKVTLTFIPTPDYEYINPDFQMKEAE